MEQQPSPSSKSPLRSRLGKGLGALLSDQSGPATAAPVTSVTQNSGQMVEKQANSQTDNAADIRRLPLNLIDANPFQPRRTFSDESLQELSQSLKANGLVQPIIVIATGARFQLIAGERRLRAAKLAGLGEITAIIRIADPALQATLALVENIHREDLNPIDRAESYKAILEANALTQAELADRLGDQRSRIANHLRLLELADPVRQLVRDGKLSLGHAKVLAGVPADRQAKLAAATVDAGWSVRHLEAQIADLLAAAPTPPKARLLPSSHLQDLAQQLTRTLGVRAQVVPGGKKGTGRLVLHYSTLDEFDALLTQMGIKLDV